ncbi:MAG: hypothetical protein AAF333_06630 [Planctomycetota bacterium]
MNTAASTTPAPTLDVAGTPIEDGDTVVTVNGQSTGKVVQIKREDDVHFICLRPVHQAYGKGVWYASDQVFWVARPGGAKKDESVTPPKPGNTPTTPSTKPASAAKSTVPSARSTPARKK